MSTFIRLDDLMGRLVRDDAGRPVGRVFDVVAEERDGSLEIVEYHLGPHALRDRMAFALHNMSGHLAGRHLRRVPWSGMDIRDPRRPVLRR